MLECQDEIPQGTITRSSKTGQKPASQDTSAYSQDLNAAANVVKNHKEALIYCRVSGKSQENTSLESQEAACVKHAEALGYQVGCTIKEAYTGAELWDRPKLSEVRADIRTGRYGALIVYSTDRLSRDPVHLAIIADDCERGHCELLFVTETFEDSDEGKLVQYIRSYANKREREKIKERTMRGRHQRALDGKVSNAGRELFGYRRQDGVRVIYEPEAAIVRRIFHLLVEERMSCNAIMKLFNAEGVQAPGSRYQEGRVRWYACTVSRLARNRVYKGEGFAWICIGVKRQGGKYLSKQRPVEEHIKLPDGVVPAIVSPEVWELAQDCIKRWVHMEPNPAQGPYLLQGMVFCGKCEKERGKLRSMHSLWRHKNGNNPASPRIKWYHCTSYSTPLGPCGAPSFLADRLDAEVWARVCETMKRPELVEKAIEKVQQTETDRNLQEDIEKAKRNIGRLESKQQEYMARYTDSADSSFPWKLVEQEIKRLEAEKKDWENILRKGERRVQEQEAASKQLVHVREYLWRLNGNLEAADFDTRVGILRGLHIKVIVQDGDWYALGLLTPEEVDQTGRTPF
jgi:site-specific DNA recombinase